MALVLCTGSEPEVMRKRRQFLEKAGHTVVPAMNEKELSEACQQYEFDVAIIGPTLSPKMKMHVATLLREHCPDVKVLELSQTLDGHAIEDADSWIQAFEDVPQDLARQVAELAKTS